MLAIMTVRVNRSTSVRGISAPIVCQLNAVPVAKLGNPDLVAALLAAGANPCMRDPIYGLTVIHDAAREGFEDTVRVLLDYGADVNVADDRGFLPLHLAAMKGHSSVVRLLSGRTALP
ncbi:hypothetical protein WMY93_025335 [Mugilogobius chulae]|uniref:Cyclin-dependent kinase inhibitor 2C (p18, inhibits CDK4) n=1 Tax=Mugilogobius chulae TaxID=88201 RepID=A0AAW0NCN5_9GOBI